MIYPTRNHPSRYHDQSIVYPVVSRRAGGVSIGVNLSPSKWCNFGCVYCQVHVDRTREAERLAAISPLVDLARLKEELSATVAVVTSGALFREERFAATPPEKRILRDFAFSGDGEPTLSPQFAEAARILAETRRDLALDSLKLVLITNGTTLQAEQTVAGCETLSANNGEIWIKLDAGSEALYRRMNRSAVPFGAILENILFAARRFPVVIQTMLLAEGKNVPTEGAFEDYCQVLRHISDSGGQIRRVQLYTVARAPAENDVSPLDDAILNRWGERVAEETGLSVEVFYSK